MRNIIVVFLLIVAGIARSEAQVVWSGTVSRGSINAAAKEKSAKDDVRLNTTLKETTFKRDVADAFIVPYDADGNPLDTIRSEVYRWNGVTAVRSADLSIPVSRNDTIIVFDAGAPGYQTQTLTWTIEPFGKKEQSRQMPFTMIR